MTYCNQSRRQVLLFQPDYYFLRIFNMVFNLIFASQWGYVGLAMATSLSALLNAGLLYFGLHQLGVFKVSKETFVLILRMFASAVVMAIGIWWLNPAFEDWLQFDVLQGTLKLVGLMVLAALIYLGMLALVGIRVRHLIR